MPDPVNGTDSIDTVTPEPEASVAEETPAPRRGRKPAPAPEPEPEVKVEPGTVEDFVAHLTAAVESVPEKRRAHAQSVLRHLGTAAVATKNVCDDPVKVGKVLDALAAAAAEVLGALK